MQRFLYNPKESGFKVTFHPSLALSFHSLQFSNSLSRPSNTSSVFAVLFTSSLPLDYWATSCDCPVSRLFLFNPSSKMLPFWKQGTLRKQERVLP